MKKQNRRQLLAGVCRYAALGLLGAVGGYSLVRRRRLLREGKCVNNGICRGCRVFDNCGLPVARSARGVLESTTDGRK